MPSAKKIIKIALSNPQSALLQGFHKLRRKSRLEYNLKSGWSLCPDFITFLITKRCNYRCYRCSAHAPEEMKEQLAAEMTTDDYKRIIDEVAPYKPAIYFCGGEPTLRDDLVEIIKYIKKKKMLCAMTTNASLLEEKLAKDLVESGIDFISISLDGDEAAHDRSRGIPGAYKNVLRGVRNLQKYRGKKSRPHIKLVGIIDPENPIVSRHVLEMAKSLGVDEANFGHLMFYPKNVKIDQEEFAAKYKIGSDYITGMEAEKDFQSDISGLKKMIREIRKFEGVHTSIAQGFEIDVEKYYASPYQYPSLKSECMTPWFSAIIRPDGNVSSCMEFDVGNIKERKFLKIWNDPKWKLFRRLKSRKKEHIPACFRCGEGQKIKFD
ncbi:MAG TPA: radical SAM protein [Candidatus Moranbacteria bacterium]|nr:radical SAM protein [Candidatus Moranbacteria bacterium]